MFSVNDLALTPTIDRYSNVLESISVEDESFFLSALKEMVEIRRDYFEYRKILSKSILESGNDRELLTEGFSEFYDKVKAIISRILQFFKSLFERFITALNKIVMSEKYLIKHEKDFTKFDSKDEFDFNGYVYSFNDTVPVCSILKDFETGFPGLDPDRLTANTGTNKTYIDSQYEDLLKFVESDGQYDIVRQKVICANTPIYKEDYSDELFRVYRSGQSSKEDITINSSKVIENITYLKEYKKTMDSVKRSKDRIEREYNDLEKFIKSMITKGSSNATDVVNMSLKGSGELKTKEFTVSKDTMTNIDLFINAKCNQIMEISNIHTLAFSAKLDAIKEDYKQTKSILYKALQLIQKREGGKKNV